MNDNLSRLMQAVLRHLEQCNDRELRQIREELEVRRPVLKVIEGGRNE